MANRHRKNGSTAFVIKENAIQNHNDTMIKKANNNKFWSERREIGTLYTAGGTVTLCSHCKKTDSSSKC